MLGRSLVRRRPAWAASLAVVFTGVTAAVAWASHWAANGWRDMHYNYPPRPSGYSGIVSVFGQPCNPDASAITMYWPAADDGILYRVVFHKKLGGAAVPGWSYGKGGLSTNLDNDVRGHIGNAHLDPYVLGGIWGYYCRYIKDSTNWSTHAWGIAIDQNARYEHYGHCHIHTMHPNVIQIFKDHRWVQLDCDPMHFQYATNY